MLLQCVGGGGGSTLFGKRRKVMRVRGFTHENGNKGGGGNTTIELGYF